MGRSNSKDPQIFVAPISPIQTQRAAALFVLFAHNKHQSIDYKGGRSPSTLTIIRSNRGFYSFMEEYNRDGEHRRGLDSCGPCLPSTTSCDMAPTTASPPLPSCDMALTAAPPVQWHGPNYSLPSPPVL